MQGPETLTSQGLSLNISLITNANATAPLIYSIPTCPRKVLIVLFRSQEKPRPLYEWPNEHQKTGFKTLVITFHEKSMLAQISDDIIHPNQKRFIHSLV